MLSRLFFGDNMLSIAKWDIFECPTVNRRPRKAMDWHCVPVELNSSGRLELVAKGESGLVAYAVFMMLVQYSASQPMERRGVLRRSNGEPLSTQQLCQIVGCSPKIFEKSLQILIKIGWILVSDKSEQAETNLDKPLETEIVSREEEIRKEEIREEKRIKREKKEAEQKWFDEFWSYFPRKQNKKAARAAFDKAIEEADVHNIINAARLYSESRVVAEGRFIMNPNNWLTKGAYDDDPAEWNRIKAPENETFTQTRIKNTAIAATNWEPSERKRK